MTRGYTITEVRELITENCCHCGVLFAMDADLREQRLGDKGWFYCPNGHSQQYLGKTWQTQIKEAERRAASAEDDARVATLERDEARREARRLKRRAAGGACPHCNRNFVQLARHIHNKHPEQAHDTGGAA